MRAFLLVGLILLAGCQDEIHVSVFNGDEAALEASGSS